MTERERGLAAARFQAPDRIPVQMYFTGDYGAAHGVAAMNEIMADHRVLWPGFKPLPDDWKPAHAPWRRAGAAYTDSWGCVWKTVADGMTGAVVRHPLADWDALTAFAPPDPARQEGWGPIDWGAQAKSLDTRRRAGKLASGSLRHGYMFLTLTYLRGYEACILDMADEEPRLDTLAGMVERFNAELVQRWLDLDVEWLEYPEDLGMQVGPMLSPAQFRRYLAPAYTRLMAPAFERGVVVYVHSDGDIRTLAEDLLACGVTVLNLQDSVNGIDWIRDHLKGRVAIDLDIDRQHITARGSAAEIDEHIHRVVEELDDPRGGLMLKAAVGPSTLPANAAALADALEWYCTRDRNLAKTSAEDREADAPESRPPVAQRRPHA